MKKTLTALAAALAIVCLAAPTLSAGDNAKELRSVRPIAYGVEVEEGVWVYRNGCTASSINDKMDYWLTAAHCLPGVYDEVDFEVRMVLDGFPVHVLDVSPETDLAVIFVPGTNVKALKMGPDVHTGDRVILAGHPLGTPDGLVFYGTVANPSWEDPRFDKPYATFQLSGAGGNSGSPVLDSQGRVVSVLQVGFGANIGFFNVMGGAPTKVLRNFAGKYFER